MKEELNRCLNCIKKPCMNNCPLNNDIPSIIKLIKEDKLDEANDLLISTTCLPSICGRICNHPCMLNCTKSKIDRSIDIGNIESYLGDLYLDKPYKIRDEENKKIAIIGSGPSSLTCSYFLRKEGYQVTIYEKHSKLGGLLEYGIPPFRLDRTILEKNINKIINMGIKVELNKEITNLEELNNYDAIYIGIGANKSRRLNINGEELNNVYGANELLEYNNHPDYTNKIVSIIGGGNVALDIARTIKRLNPKEVNIIYRRSEKEMPASISEIEDAKQEGINFIYQTNILNIYEKEIELIKTDLIDKGEGRLSPVNIEGTNYKINNDILIKALGSIPDNSIDLEKENNYIKVNNYQTSNKKVFAGGDIIGNRGTVSSCARDGRNAAIEIIKYLKENM